MNTMASQIISLTIVYSTVYSGKDQRKYQSSASLAFVWGIHRGPVTSPHKRPGTQEMSPFDDVIMLRGKCHKRTTIAKKQAYGSNIRVCTMVSWTSGELQLKITNLINFNFMKFWKWYLFVSLNVNGIVISNFQTYIVMISASSTFRLDYKMRVLSTSSGNLFRWVDGACFLTSS